VTVSTSQAIPGSGPGGIARYWADQPLALTGVK
jgi:hypothetical protein